MAGTAILGASIIGSTAISANAAGNASEAQAQATDNAAEIQRDMFLLSRKDMWEMYNQSRKDTAPWRNAGQKAVNALWATQTKGPGKFEASPGYQFRLQEGEKAILRNRAATGGVASGATLKALTRFGQDEATKDYDNFLNRWYDRLRPLQSLAGVGQTAASQNASNAIATGQNMGQNAMTTGANLGQTAINLGAARASGYINQANAANSGVGNIINLASLYQRSPRQPFWTPQMVTGNTLPAGSTIDTSGAAFLA